MKRKLMKCKAGQKVSRFVVTFDEYAVVDTIERDGELLVSTHRDAQAILRNADALHSGVINQKLASAGFLFDKGR